MKPTTQVNSIDDADYEALIERVRISSLEERDRNWLVSILQTFRFIQSALEQKKVAVHKLKEMLFGKKTEKDKPKRGGKGSSKPGVTGAASGGGVAPSVDSVSSGPPSQSNSDLHPILAPDQNESSKSPEEKALDLIAPPENPKSPPPGHGRRPSDSWENATEVKHCHDCLKKGQVCPKCNQGKLYPYKNPAVFVRIVGRAPLGIEVHSCDRLRCNRCGELFTAPVPQDVNKFPVSTPEANAVAAVTKYQAATPFNRFANVLTGYGVPLPRSRLYSMSASVAEDAHPVFTALCRFAAQGDLFHNDDTKGLVQALIKENNDAEQAGIELERKGMFTSGIIAQVKEHRIFLYFTGRNHAGENLQNILKQRAAGLPPPTQVSDRSTSNEAKGFDVDDGGCLDHGRREFYDIRHFFPTSCGYVLKELKTVYRADAIAKKKNLTPEGRLELHQKVSLPVMERIKKWGETQLDEKLVEPNGPLGKAIKYFLKHYPALTLFTRKENVPISNAACEQSLKAPIAIRKMAYFFKTVESALVASILLSLIQTCTYIGENVFDYFVALQRHSSDVRKKPEEWFPWNFRKRLKVLLA
jgi:transposase